MKHYIIVFQNFRFHPPTRKRKAGVLKNLHSVITGHAVEGGPNRSQQRRRVDAAYECIMLPLEEFGHLPSQEVQEHCLQFQSLTDLLQ